MGCGPVQCWMGGSLALGAQYKYPLVSLPLVACLGQWGPQEECGVSPGAWQAGRLYHQCLDWSELGFSLVGGSQRFTLCALAGSMEALNGLFIAKVEGGTLVYVGGSPLLHPPSSTI